MRVTGMRGGATTAKYDVERCLSVESRVLLLDGEDGGGCRQSNVVGEAMNIITCSPAVDFGNPRRADSSDLNFAKSLDALCAVVHSVSSTASSLSLPLEVSRWHESIYSLSVSVNVHVHFFLSRSLLPCDSCVPCLLQETPFVSVAGLLLRLSRALLED